MNKLLVLALTLSSFPTFAVEMERQSHQCALSAYKTSATSSQSTLIGSKGFEVLLTLDALTGKTIETQLISKTPLSLELKTASISWSYGSWDNPSFFDVFFKFKKLNRKAAQSLVKELKPETSLVISESIDFDRVKASLLAYPNGERKHFQGESKTSTQITSGTDAGSIVDFKITCNYL